MAESVEITHPAAIDRALREIRTGHVIVLPVESGYIFAADAFNRSAVASLHLLRSDPSGQAASVMIGDKSRIVGITREISPAAHALIDRFWPGLLTIYLRPHPALTWDLGDGRLLDQVAVRVPQHDFATQLLNETGPLVVAGACLAGRTPIAQPVLINEVFGSHLDLIFDGGDVPAVKQSTVVDCTTTPARLIRHGDLEATALREAWPEITEDVG
jgi:tRNA threonylcarbamoyl adenosine modification protein (Sua5/YciO/YrdC/YwlC family)